MPDRILEKDSDVHLPACILLKASAGSGKTHTLTKRFVQFLLSKRIDKNNLRNILAITFSNNAAREMKERTLGWLKEIYFGDPETLNQIEEVVSQRRENLKEEAERLIDTILDNYTDFQVKTIDSYMTSIFKASAIEFGYTPDFEITLTNKRLITYAFDLFLRDVREGSYKAELMEKVTKTIIRENRKGDSAFLWNPANNILSELETIYKKLTTTGKRVVMDDFSSDLKSIKERIREKTENLDAFVENSGLERNSKCTLPKILGFVRGDRFPEILDLGVKSVPVKKVKKKDIASLYDSIVSDWMELTALIGEYVTYFALTFYYPYLKVYKEFEETIERVNRQQSTVYIGDINRNIKKYLDEETAPDIYFRIGETIYHYLIDEFQDTSPVQWTNMFLLVENSLSQGGSLFAVGDTKQGIYGFRDADYRIMKELEKENRFLSAEIQVKELETNYRSLERIIEFNDKVFKERLSSTDYKDLGDRSGLTDFIQKVRKGKEGLGYSEVTILPKDRENLPERRKILELTEELTQRGYNLGDIAILTSDNDTVVQVSEWLNEGGRQFISYSSLDVRIRRITGEIVSLLKFLDSPVDDLSFMTFCTGLILKRSLKRDFDISEEDCDRTVHEFLFNNRESEDRPFYIAFQREFPHYWSRYFSMLFKESGYLPLYDLAVNIFNTFDLFETFTGKDSEEATLVKILEIIKNFEDTGKNSLRDFILYALDEDSGDSEWNIDAPERSNAVQVMTIHKSKGLGFPVVILLLYGEKHFRPGYFLLDDDDGVRLLKLTGKMAAFDPLFRNIRLNDIYGEEEAKYKVNGLNSLYVGFTRAKSEIYVIGVKGERESKPFTLLPDEEFAPAEKPLEVFKEVIGEGEVAPIYHCNKKIEHTFEKRESIHFMERGRGDFIHSVLCHILFTGGNIKHDLRDIIETLNRVKGEDYPVSKIADLLKSFFKREEIREYFLEKEGRVVMNEEEFLDSRGNLYRMDRVIKDKEKITVMDYKTGSERLNAYERQLRQYINVLKEIYPDKAVEGVIAFIDMNRGNHRLHRLK